MRPSQSSRLLLPSDATARAQCRLSVSVWFCFRVIVFLKRERIFPNYPVSIVEANDIALFYRTTQQLINVGVTVIEAHP